MQVETGLVFAIFSGFMASYGSRFMMIHAWPSSFPLRLLPCDSFPLDHTQNLQLKQPLRDMRIICESYMEYHSECPNRPNLLVFVVYHVSYNSGRSKCASGAWSSHCGTIGRWCSPEASGAISTDHKWGFPKIGVPLVIIHLNGNFPELNHPAMGAPPFSDTS